MDAFGRYSSVGMGGRDLGFLESRDGNGVEMTETSFNGRVLNCSTAHLNGVRRIRSMVQREGPRKG